MQISSWKQTGVNPHALVWALAIAAYVAAVAAPAFADLYWLRILTSIWMFVAIAQSMNIMAGFLGYPAFGNVVFFGLGSYSTAIAITKLHWPVFAAVSAGLIPCAILVLVVGPPILRLRGHYFAIATLGLNETMKSLVANMTTLTGGGLGLSLPLPSEPLAVSARNFYWAFLGLSLLSIFVALFLRTTRFGYACRAILANEDGAESMGINTTFYKTATWLLSASLAALAGGLYALWLGYIDPPSVFDMTIAVKGFVMFLIGGAGTILGPVVGAFLLELAANLSWSYLLKYHLAILGIIIMAAAVVIARGLPKRALLALSRSQMNRPAEL